MKPMCTAMKSLVLGQSHTASEWASSVNSGQTHADKCVGVYTASPPHLQGKSQGWVLIRAASFAVLFFL